MATRENAWLRFKTVVRLSESWFSLRNDDSESQATVLKQTRVATRVDK